MSGEIWLMTKRAGSSGTQPGRRCMDHEQDRSASDPLLVDVNMLLNLPDRSAVLYGVGVCPS